MLGLTTGRRITVNSGGTLDTNTNVTTANVPLTITPNGGTLSATTAIGPFSGAGFPFCFHATCRAAVVRIFDQTHQLAIGYAMICVLLTIVGVLGIFVGLMLNALRAFALEIRRAVEVR